MIFRQERSHQMAIVPLVNNAHQYHNFGWKIIGDTTSDIYTQFTPMMQIIWVLLWTVLVTLAAIFWKYRRYRQSILTMNNCIAVLTTVQICCFTAVRMPDY